MPTNKNLLSLKKELRSVADSTRASGSMRFFKTGKGEYGEGDVFLGITVPAQRNICKKYTGLTLEEITTLLHSKEHEFRSSALFILVEKNKQINNTKPKNTHDSKNAKKHDAETQKQKKEIFNLYLENTKWINNWDLVDCSASYIVGEYLENSTDKIRILKHLAHSKSLWERRISMIATFAYINKGRSEEALLIANILLNDQHDLIQKAVGWMLREMGKKVSEKVLYNFLDAHAKTMPRTTLRYAIERISPNKKEYYMKLKTGSKK